MLMSLFCPVRRAKSFSFSRVRPLLTLQRKTRLISVDLPGFGGSSVPGMTKESNPYSLTNQAQAIADFCTALGITTAHIVGHSMGSIISLALAVQHPGIPLSLFLCGPANACSTDPTFLDEDEGLKALAEDPELTELTEEFLREFQCGTLMDKDFERPGYKEFVDAIIGESMKVTVEAFKGAVHGMMEDEVLANVEAITCGPNMLVTGAGDELFPPVAHAMVLKERIRDSSVVIMEGAGHSPNWDKPEEVAALLNQHLNTQVSKL